MGENQQRPPPGDAETVPIASPGAQDVEFSAAEPAAKTPELTAGAEVGGYVIENKIGEGGMGQVYGARHPRIGKRVAIKVLAASYTSTDPSALSRFEQEARLVNQIHHPNIVDVFQFGELPDKRSYFVMEWLDGESLSARIARSWMPADEVIEILDVLCDALDAAHEKGVVHRDLKSDNVFLVTTRGKRTAKLLDFGVAKLSKQDDVASVALTRSGIVVGTPAYMSPEQARGKAVDGRTDVYALGVLAYKMLTGALPFKADNPMDMIAAHLGTPPPSPEKLAPKTPPELARLVVRMMAKAPEERPTLAELRSTFAKLREPKPGTPVPRRAKSVLMGALLFLAGVVALGTIWMIQRNKPNDATATVAQTGNEPTQPSGARGAPTGTAVGSNANAASAAAKPNPPTPSTDPLSPSGSATSEAPTGSAGLPSPASGSAAAGSASPATGSAAAGSASPATASSAMSAAAGSAATGSAATGSAGAPLAGSAASIGPAGSAVPGSAASVPKKRAPPKRADEPKLVTRPPPAKRPGAIFLTLETASVIEIDGETIAQGSYGGRFEVAPGYHEIRVKAPGRQPVVRDVEVEPGGNAVIRIDDDTSGGN